MPDLFWNTVPPSIELACAEHGRDVAVNEQELPRTVDVAIVLRSSNDSRGHNLCGCHQTLWIIHTTESL